MAGEGRAYELSEPYHPHIAANFWMGSFERGLELAREGSEIGRRRLRGTHDGTADRSLEEAVTIIH